MGSILMSELVGIQGRCRWEEELEGKNDYLGENGDEEGSGRIEYDYLCYILGVYQWLLEYGNDCLSILL